MNAWQSSSGINVYLDRRFFRGTLLALGQRRFDRLDSLVSVAADLDVGSDLQRLRTELLLNDLDQFCLYVVADVAFVEHRSVTKCARGFKLLPSTSAHVKAFLKVAKAAAFSFAFLSKCQAVLL